ELIEQRTQHLDLAVQPQLGLLHITVGHADAEAVVADQSVVLRNALPEPPDAWVLPVEFEVTDPPRRNDERWALPTDLVRQAPGTKREEADFGLVEHRPERTTA